MESTPFYSLCPFLSLSFSIRLKRCIVSIVDSSFSTSAFSALSGEDDLGGSAAKSDKKETKKSNKKGNEKGKDGSKAAKKTTKQKAEKVNRKQISAKEAAKLAKDLCK